MEIVNILRELSRRRIPVAVVAFVAVLVGVLLIFRPSLPPQSRQYEVGLASARILVDTPNSQVVEVAPKGSETLGARASVLANLMTEGEVKAAIAGRAGLRPKQLLAVSESSIEPKNVAPSEMRDPKAHLLTTRVVIDADGAQLPIIEIAAQAPDTAGATKLANAAVSGLSDYLDSRAALEQVADGRRLRVSGLGTAQATVAVRGVGRLIALAAAIFVFLAGCALIVVVSALARSWHEATEAESDLFDPFDPELTLALEPLIASDADIADAGEPADDPAERWPEFTPRGAKSA